MAKKVRKKITPVREHPMKVPVSKLNPAGITIRDRHLRRLTGTKRNSLATLFVPFLICGCSTSSFKLLDQKGMAVELEVTPDRVQLECEPQPEHEIENAHGFLMYVLDDKNTVVTLAKPSVIDEEECFDWLQKIGKILKKGKTIYVGGIGDLNEAKVSRGPKQNFPGLGVFASNGKTLNFIVIANDSDLCFDAYNGDQSPCPSEPFSLKHLK